MKTIIVSASHNLNRIPAGTGCLSVLAGSALFHAPIPDGVCRDDLGENISEKNREYCELTALYWAWKNLDADILGLCHYRRYFESAEKRGTFLQPDEAEHLLGYYDVLLPSERNYIFETNYTQYCNAHHNADLDITSEIIAEKYPEYKPAFDKRMAMTRGHRFNMFVMRKELSDEYCEWLFDMLSELEKRLNISEYTEKDRRVFGYVAERLLDVWIDAKGLRSAELKYTFIGNEHLVRKAAVMMMRKIKAASWHLKNRF